MSSQTNGSNSNLAQIINSNINTKTKSTSTNLNAEDAEHKNVELEKNNIKSLVTEKEKNFNKDDINIKEHLKNAAEIKDNNYDIKLKNKKTPRITNKINSKSNIRDFKLAKQDLDINNEPMANNTETNSNFIAITENNFITFKTINKNGEIDKKNSNKNVEKVNKKVSNKLESKLDKQDYSSTLYEISQLVYFSYLCFNCKKRFGIRFNDNSVSKILVSKELRLKYSFSHYLSNLEK